MKQNTAHGCGFFTAGHWAAGLLLVAHYLERVADRATNIAERIVFIQRGDVIQLNP